jgi:hypothetical protein
LRSLGILGWRVLGRRGRRGGEVLRCPGAEVPGC